MAYVKINKNFSIDQNFWELNRQMEIIPPYSRVHAIDGGGYESSKIMWVVFFLSDPDREENRFADMGYEKAKEALSETYAKEFNWDDPLFLECLESYPYDCLNSTARSIKELKDLTKRISTKLKNSEITFDRTVNGKKEVGTINQITRSLKDMTKLYEDFEALEEKYLEEKSTSEVFGGREETATEKGLI